MEVVLESIKPGVPIAHTWETVAEVYKARSKHVVKPKQVNNHYNNCRSKWVAWNAMNQMTGIALTDDGLPTEIELQSDRMKQFLQKYKAGAYVTKHKLPDLDLWNSIFSGRCATGANSYSPASARAELESHKRKANGKGHVLGDVEDESSGDSEDPQHTPEPYVNSEEPAESRSPPNTTSSKRQKRASTSVSKQRPTNDLNKAFDILKMVDGKETRERKLYLAVKNMEQVKMRGLPFQARAIFYLTEKNLGKMFLEFETDEEKWEWLKVLDVDDDFP
ncbi:unnamed protein product [Rhodiola kirilowii]